MLTLCWAAKGGSGTTVVAAALTLLAPRPVVAVDLGGDLPAVLGLGDEGPGVHDWLRSNADAGRLDALARDVHATARVIAAGAIDPPDARGRWRDLADALTSMPDDVVVDAGADDPPSELAAAADRRLLVTRPCYLSVTAAAASGFRPTGIVLIDEPGRQLRRADVERAVGAPVVAELLLDPAVARAVDSGLLLARLPRPFRRRIEAVAA